MREIEWTGTALEDMAALDKGNARRVKQTVERFADTGAGNVKRLQGIDPPEYRLRVGDHRGPLSPGGHDPGVACPQPARSLPLKDQQVSSWETPLKLQGYVPSVPWFPVARLRPVSRERQEGYRTRRNLPGQGILSRTYHARAGP